MMTKTTDQTLIAVTVEGEDAFTCTLRSFCISNDMVEEAEEIMRSIADHGSYQGGGGAAPEFVITLA